MLAIIDYDTGNTKSLQKAFSYLQTDTVITADPAIIAKAEALILPGVGAFPEAMAELTSRGLVPLLKEAAAAGKPILGVCLGMQLLLEGSEEHRYTKGLGLIPGTAKRLPAKPAMPVPHMGWNQLELQQGSPITKGLAGEYVYYVHSYYADCPSGYIYGSSTYSTSVTGIIAAGHTYGVQFHPEKSGQVGLTILKNFMEVVRACRSSQQSI
ncbi:imidazole glycerol phosphate synthase subunit HisH [Listeria grayi]|uniref:imidazole glycerol phosphate synthase subunit HisH n=1 Tax=Listeria grayi TaxID=1641 RepID=UPI0016280663|nr:imidazole glycerol phosphate synthase subunit HisH [Listeria grayi]MBC1922729.1 imidazole glycerol phosphate synthase subunit HisH [Listeria grayi]